MKKRISALLAALMLFSLGACGSGNGEDSGSGDAAFSADLTAFSETLFQGDEAPMMMPVDDTMIEDIYPGLAAVERKQTVLLTAAISAVAAEAAMVEVANAADVETVKNIFQARIDYQIVSDDPNVPPGAWYPATIESWKNNSEIVVKGNYVCLFVGESKDEMVSAFEALG